MDHGVKRPTDGETLGVEVKKKSKKVPFEQLYLDRLPSAELYERSWQHREVVTHCLVTKTDYIVTGSADGHIKFWKKQPEGIEFVKHFRSHLGPVSGMAASSDGALLCTVSSDKSLKLYDVLSFDMINMLELPDVPSAIEFVSTPADARPLVACASRDTSAVLIIEPSQSATPVHRLSMHSAPVSVLKYNQARDVVISCDTAGHVEYWSAHGAGSSAQPYTAAAPPLVSFRYKTETDLYHFAQKKTHVVSMAISSDGAQWAAFGRDRLLRVFRFDSGKLVRVYDESLSTLVSQPLPTSADGQPLIDTMEFGRRMTVERELDSAQRLAGGRQTVPTPETGVAFDESGTFVMYASMLGIKLVNIVTNRVARVLGRGEAALRFVGLALYQGKTRGSVALDNLTVNAEHDPIVIATAFNKSRFYMLTRREPRDIHDEEGSTRDVLNERPSREELAAALKPAAARRQARSAVIHTTLGDIHVTLFGSQCPKTVENFSVHSKNGYYNNIIFHRVIKNFMIQTGDPLGDGTGGESIWGGEFDDEFDASLTHARPFMLSMANAGPNTNGSQFFITTVPCARLDFKHTVFGEVSKGTDVVKLIEASPVNKHDKPYDEVKILSITVSFADD
eukprot:TRINITY_DN1038_c0_g1_i1.p1 TRINITY_DN1038_c0_g1~~TRINITY_DN1038_c0_g1_i1.p1  ORF type:complete len:621 (+),score=197.52 TRINITY_DN1038_c0_g1_i1:105-1967(+)